MQLQPGTTYRNRNGNQVHVMGLAKVEPLNGEPVYSSAQGDHYTESGLFVFSRQVSREPLTLERYTRPDAWSNIAGKA